MIALGNMKNIGNIQLLKASLKDSSPIVREYAAWAILKTDYDLGCEAVLDAIKKERNTYITGEMERLLNYFHKKTLEVL